MKPIGIGCRPSPLLLAELAAAVPGVLQPPFSFLHPCGALPLPMHLSPTLLSLLAPVLLGGWVPTALAGSLNKGEPCDVNENRLQIGTYQFYGECNSHTWCNGTSGVCELKRCRNDVFPFGYQPDDWKPDMCDSGFFCPDEMSACQPLQPVGQPCQLNRDGVLKLCFNGRSVFLNSAM